MINIGDRVIVRDRTSDLDGLEGVVIGEAKGFGWATPSTYIVKTRDGQEDFYNEELEVISDD